MQSFLFVQCWPGIFCEQCRRNLCNVGAAFATTSYYQEINLPKIKIAKKWYCSDDIALGFSCATLPGVSWAILHQVFTCPNYQKIKRSKIKIVKKWCCSDNNALGFSYAMFPGTSWAILHQVSHLCNVVLRVLRQHWTGFFYAQCCLELLREQCRGYFSHTMLS